MRILPDSWDFPFIWSICVKDSSTLSKTYGITKPKYLLYLSIGSLSTYFCRTFNTRTMETYSIPIGKLIHLRRGNISGGEMSRRIITKKFIQQQIKSQLRSLGSDLSATLAIISPE